MKKLLILTFAILSFIYAPVTNAQVFGFMDNKYYDVSGTLKYFGFLDGSLYDINGKAVDRASVGLPPLPTTNNNVNPDFCRNLPNNQIDIPQGYYRNTDGDCLVRTENPIVVTNPTPTQTNPVQTSPTADNTIKKLQCFDYAEMTCTNNTDSVITINSANFWVPIGEPGFSYTVSIKQATNDSSTPFITKYQVTIPNVRVTGDNRKDIALQLDPIIEIQPRTSKIIWQYTSSINGLKGVTFINLKWTMNNQTYEFVN